MNKTDRYRPVGYYYTCYECGYKDKESTVEVRKRCPKCGKQFGYTVVELTDEKLN